MKSIVQSKGATKGASVTLYFRNKCSGWAPMLKDTIVAVHASGNVRLEKYGAFRVVNLEAPEWVNSNLLLHPLADKTIRGGECMARVSKPSDDVTISTASDEWKALQNKEIADKKAQEEMEKKRQAKAWAYWEPIFKLSKKIRTHRGIYTLIDMPILRDSTKERKITQYGVLLLVKTIDKTNVLGECLKSYNNEPIRWVMEVCKLTTENGYLGGYHVGDNLTSPTTEQELWKRLAYRLEGSR